MILKDNPVLSRELLVNLRSSRSFFLQAAYVSFLGLVVWLAWPTASEGGIMAVGAGAAQTLFNLFFFGQFFLVALVAVAAVRGPDADGDHDGARPQLDRRPAPLVPDDLDCRRDRGQPSAAEAARRGEREEGSRGRRAGDEVRHRRRHRSRPLPG